MEFKYSVAGLPSVGKSTLFDALTKAGIEAANFPFCTIEPNTGVIPMPNPHLDQLTEIVKPQRTLPTTMEFIGIAGLVRDASKDEGLGNQFLTDIRETEAIGYVIHRFENDNIIHVPGKVNPADDIEVINAELALADPDTCERAIRHVQRRARGDDKDAKAELAVLEKCLPQLGNTGMLCVLGLSAEEKAAVRYLSFLTLKPAMYIANVNEDSFEDDPYPDQVREVAAREGSVVVPACAAVEADITELNDEERDEFMQELGLEEPGLNRVIRASCKLLNLQAYLTARVKEVRTQAIPVGTTASQATGKIHTDFGKDFIRAQTISFEDFITYKDEQGARETDEMRAEGKDYIAKDSDVINFLFNI